MDGDTATADLMYRIATARPFLVNDDALLADFPQLRPSVLRASNPELQDLSPAALATTCRRITERWLVENAGLLSEAQLHAPGVTVSVVPEGPPRPVTRPPRYGRACVAEVGPTSLRIEGLCDPVSVAGGGELDLKGVGVRPGQRPVVGDYSDGLLSIRKALQEYLVERLLHRIFVHAGAAVRTLPHYAVVDTGFEGIGQGGRFPAAIIVRRAHTRDPRSDLPAFDSEEHHLTVETELVLRRYGVTSSMLDGFTIRRDGDTLRVYTGDTPTQDSPALIGALIDHFDLEVPFLADRVNIQMDAGGDEIGGRRIKQLVDFGHYHARTSFDRPLVSLVSDRPMAWGGMLIPSDACFAQPDPALTPTGPLWREACQPRAGLFVRFASELASAFHGGEIGHAGVRARVAAALDQLTSAWPRARGSADTADLSHAR